jgi:hypothetical protein
MYAKEGLSPKVAVQLLQDWDEYAVKDLLWQTNSTVQYIVFYCTGYENIHLMKSGENVSFKGNRMKN